MSDKVICKHDDEYAIFLGLFNALPTIPFNKKWRNNSNGFEPAVSGPNAITSEDFLTFARSKKQTDGTVIYAMSFIDDRGEIAIALIHGDNRVVINELFKKRTKGILMAYASENLTADLLSEADVDSDLSGCNLMTHLQMANLGIEAILSHFPIEIKIA